MSDLSGQVGELRFTVQIKRAATGLVEEIELVGKITDDELKDTEDGSHPLNSSPQRSD